MVTYEFNYKINTCTYRFNYAHCDRMITKDSSGIALSHKSNLLTEDTISKNYSTDTRNIDYSVVDNILETNKYALFYLKDYSLSRQHSILNIQDIKSLLSISRLVLLNPDILLNRKTIKYIDMLSAFLLYRPKPNIYNCNINKLLKYPLYRWTNIAFDYFLKRKQDLISFKPSLNSLYRPFKHLLIDDFIYSLIINQSLIQSNKSIWLDRVKNNIASEYEGKVLNKDFERLDSILEDIKIDIKELDIDNILDIYLYKENKNIINWLNIGLYKDFKDISSITDTIYTCKDFKDISSITDAIYTYKDTKEVFKSNILNLAKYDKIIRNYFRPKSFIKQSKVIKYSKVLALDKYNLMIDIIDFLHLFEQSEKTYIYEKLNNLGLNFKPLSYDLTDILINDNFKPINITSLLKLINSPTKSIDYSKVDLNAYRSTNNIISIYQEKSLNIIERLLFYCIDIPVEINAKDISIEDFSYFLLQNLKSVYLSDSKSLSEKNNLDAFVKQNSLFLNNITKRNIKLEENDYHKLKLWQRFWFLLPNGQTDNLILPNCDYPYEDEPIDGINKHPIQAGKDINIGEIPLSINIMIDLINILIFMWCKFYNAFWGCTGSQAVLDTVMYVYQWLNLETSIDEQIKKGSKEHYDRCYRWLRWEAEKVILMARNDTNLNGNYYVQVLIENLIQYMLNHHFDVMPVFKDIEKMDEWRNIFNINVENDIDWVIDKLKGIRHKTLEKLKEELQ